MKKGFTLVELSIVLVIIGLLIGGILVAQSMIGTAKVQAFVRQIGQFDSAVENFITKYNQLPGDTSLTHSGIGNNDGMINSGVSNTCDPTVISGGEIGKFWNDLYISGLSSEGNKNYTNSSALGSMSGLTPDGFAPKAVLGQDAYVVPYCSVAAGTNFWYAGGYNPSYYNTIFAYKPAEVLAVDIKMDDGKADSGEVRSIDQSALSDAVSLGDIQNGNDCAAGPAYSVQNNGLECSIRIRMGLSTGNLK